MTYRDVDSRPQMRPPHLLPASVAGFLEKRRGRCRRILIPLDSEQLREGVFDSVIDAARLTSAELILLMVHPLAPVKKHAADQERLFTTLKALQAQMQSYCLRLKFDSVTGPAAASIVEYAHSHNVDLIVMAGENADAEHTAQTVLIEAHCPTYIVQEN